MPTTTVNLNSGSLASGYCPSSWQQLLNDFVARTSATVPGGLGVIVSSTEPGPDDRDKVWVRLDGVGQPRGQYIFINGEWVWPHDFDGVIDANERRLFGGSEAQVWAYDGGDGTNPAGPPTPQASSGAMWEADHNFDARFPVGPGTTAGGTVIAVGGTGGSDQTLLDGTNMPRHRHAYGIETNGESAAAETGTLHTTGTTRWDASETTADVAYTRYIGETTPVKFTNLPPYRGIWLIKRTARIYYKAA